MSNVFRLKKEENIDSKPTRYFSSIQENSIAEAVEGKQTKNSGATMWQKGDVMTDKWLLEAKTKMTNSKSFSIKKEWLDKIKDEALFMGKEYEALVFNFGPDKPNYYIINESTFQELLEYQNNK